MDSHVFVSCFLFAWNHVLHISVKSYLTSYFCYFILKKKKILLCWINFPVTVSNFGGPGVPASGPHRRKKSQTQWVKVRKIDTAWDTQRETNIQREQERGRKDERWEPEEWEKQMNVSCGESAGNEVNSPGEMRMGKAAAGPRSTRFLQSAGPLRAETSRGWRGQKQKMTQCWLNCEPQGTQWCQRQQGARCDSSLIYGETDTNGSLMRVEIHFLSVQYKYAGIAARGNWIML